MTEIILAKDVHASNDINGYYAENGNIPPVVRGDVWDITLCEDDSEKADLFDAMTGNCNLTLKPSISDREDVPSNRQIKPTAYNIHQIIENAEWFQNMFKWNDRAKHITIMRRTPASGSTAVDAGGCEITEVHMLEIQHFLEYLLEENIPKGHVHDAVMRVARKRSFDPVRDYLDSVLWDGKPRIDTLLIDAYGADDSNYTRSVTSKWMISAVARTMKPGCYVDTCLTLLSTKQGRGKSKGMSALIPDYKWFLRGIPDMHSKDSLHLLHGPWVVELDELSGATRSAQEQIKSFISAERDKFRVPFGRGPEWFERSGVFFATTNDVGYLKDSTGSRRFWTVQIPSHGRSSEEIQAMMTSVRDQAWAEAVARYRAGEKWWMSQEDSEESEQVQSAFWAEHPWSPQVTQIMGSNTDRGWTKTELLHELARKEKENGAIDLLRLGALEMQKMQSALDRIGATYRKPRGVAETALNAARTPKYYLTK